MNEITIPDKLRMKIEKLAIMWKRDQVMGDTSFYENDGYILKQDVINDLWKLLKIPIDDLVVCSNETCSTYDRGTEQCSACERWYCTVCISEIHSDDDDSDDDDLSGGNSDDSENGKLFWDLEI